MTAAASSAGAAPASVEWQAGELVLTRVFDAPRALVFRAWTEPEHFARWFGPHGSTLTLFRMEVRPGGAFHYRHRFPDHEDVWVAGRYLEVAPPERLAFACWFSDGEGSRVDRPGFPAEMRIDVTLAERGGGTEVTIRQTGMARDQGEVQGWRESLDRLEAMLASGHTPQGEDR
jgi:uncharacterized protein YndB with AHSA1/START domain